MCCGRTLLVLNCILEQDVVRRFSPEAERCVGLRIAWSRGWAHPGWAHPEGLALVGLALPSLPWSGWPEHGCAPLAVLPYGTSSSSFKTSFLDRVRQKFENVCMDIVASWRYVFLGGPWR